SPSHVPETRRHPARKAHYRLHQPPILPPPSEPEPLLAHRTIRPNCEHRPSTHRGQRLIRPPGDPFHILHIHRHPLCPLPPHRANPASELRTQNSELRTQNAELRTQSSSSLLLVLRRRPPLPQLRPQLQHRRVCRDDEHRIARRCPRENRIQQRSRRPRDRVRRRPACVLQPQRHFLR